MIAVATFDRQAFGIFSGPTYASICINCIPASLEPDIILRNAIYGLHNDSSCLPTDPISRAVGHTAMIRAVQVTLLVDQPLVNLTPLATSVPSSPTPAEASMSPGGSSIQSKDGSSSAANLFTPSTVTEVPTPPDFPCVLSTSVVAHLFRSLAFYIVVVYWDVTCWRSQTFHEFRYRARIYHAAVIVKAVQGFHSHSHISVYRLRTVEAMFDRCIPTRRSSEATIGTVQVLKAHFDYLAFLFQKLPPLTGLSAAGFAFRDHLQLPLQPLADNLDSSVYETFEKDRPKYECYREALKQSLHDMHANSSRITPRLGEAGAWGRRSLDGSSDGVLGGTNNPILIAVLGAGRGPLVDAALRAADSEEVRVKVRFQQLLHCQCCWESTIVILRSVDFIGWDNFTP